MMRGLQLLILAVALPGAAIAVPPSPSKSVTAKPAVPVSPVPLTPGTRRITLSAEGRAIAQRIMGVADPRVAQIQGEMNMIRQEKLKIITGPAVDIEKLEPLLRREEALQTEFRARQNDRLLALLRALPEPDRLALLQNLANPAKPQSSKPAEPAR